MDASYSPIKRHAKLSNLVAEQIQQLILAKTIKPGDRLPSERELGDQFQVSRTVIREAIRTLEARGLLDSQSGSGNYVRALQGGDVSNSLEMYLSSQDQTFSFADIMEVRRVLEVQTVKLAAERATPEIIDRLDEIVEKMCHSQGDFDAFSKWDLEYHLTIAKACKNELFVILMEPLAGALFEEIWTASTTPGAVEDACSFHGRILDAIRNRDPLHAVELMKAHLDQSERVAREGQKYRLMDEGGL